MPPLPSLNVFKYSLAHLLMTHQRLTVHGSRFRLQRVKAACHAGVSPAVALATRAVKRQNFIKENSDE